MTPHAATPAIDVGGEETEIASYDPPVREPGETSTATQLSSTAVSGLARLDPEDDRRRRLRLFVVGVVTASACLALAGLVARPRHDVVSPGVSSVAAPAETTPPTLAAPVPTTPPPTASAPPPAPTSAPAQAANPAPAPVNARHVAPRPSVPGAPSAARTSTSPLPQGSAVPHPAPKPVPAVPGDGIVYTNPG
jgi:hypothetical protein